MTTQNTSSNNSSRAATPTISNSRFTSQASTAEDFLKAHTVGLVQHADFRKRRAEALEQKEREAQARSRGESTSEGSRTPVSLNGTPTSKPKKKKRKHVHKEKLSFGIDDEEQDSESAPATSGTESPVDRASKSASPRPDDGEVTERRRLKPNSAVGFVPKVTTKYTLLREAQAREQLRKEFITMQEAVKETEILIPFVFYDGTNIPGGVVKAKKSDYIWVFLDKSRKVGAALGIGGGGERASSKREWARVGVDDLMLVRGEIIIPHHYDFYYFIVNKTKGHNGLPLFDYSSEPPSVDTSKSQPKESDNAATFEPLYMPSRKQKKSGTLTPLDPRLEGYNDNPSITKVVDRRWYERNKHIFPASVWEEFDPNKDYSKSIRKDGKGNAFFFS